MVHPLQIKIHPSLKDDDHPLSAKIDDAPSSIRVSGEKSRGAGAGAGEKGSAGSSGGGGGKTAWQKTQDILGLLSYFHPVLALIFYILVFVDAGYIKEGMEKAYWIEIFLQIVNGGVTLLTIISCPKRLQNLPRAFRIWKAGGGGNIDGGQGIPGDIRKAQENVQKDYEWYTWEGEKAYICPPRRLFTILVLWNIGVLAQLALASILWSCTPSARPLVPYVLLNVIAAFCEFVPIPLVVMQTRRARSARELAAMDARSRMLAGARDMRSLET